jgi:hypothetical protein
VEGCWKGKGSYREIDVDLEVEFHPVSAEGSSRVVMVKGLEDLDCFGIQFVEHLFVSTPFLRCPVGSRTRTS